MVELSQIPKQHQDMANKRFTLFNTNNVWISLKSLHQKLVEDRLTVDVVTHERVVDRVKILQVCLSVGLGMGSRSMAAGCTRRALLTTMPLMSLCPTKQLETTICSVIQDFTKVVVWKVRNQSAAKAAAFVWAKSSSQPPPLPPPQHSIHQVSRARYMPVKSTSDLFLIQSNLYSMSRGMLLLNPARCVRKCLRACVCTCVESLVAPIGDGVGRLINPLTRTIAPPPPPTPQRVPAHAAGEAGRPLCAHPGLPRARSQRHPRHPPARAPHRGRRRHLRRQRHAQGGSGLLLPCLALPSLDCDERTVLLPGSRWMHMVALWLGWLTLA